MEVGSLPFWIGFNVFVLAMLALDLGVFNRKAHAVSFREAATWSAVWIALALLFNGLLLVLDGPDTATQFLTGYLIEKSLSVDNIFIFVLIFSSFAVPAAYQHRVLFFGVIGALVMRGALILAGAALIETFHWVLYVFGAFLVVTGIRMALQKSEHADMSRHWVVRLMRRVLPTTQGYEGARFVVRRGAKRMVTPLLLVLILVEVTDLIFALDSIPAIFAVTLNPFIVYTSNVFAILGLRSLYFLLAGSVERFPYLKYGLAVVLVVVGVKMLVADVVHVSPLVSLLVIAAILASSIVASLIATRKSPRDLSHLPDAAG